MKMYHRNSQRYLYIFSGYIFDIILVVNTRENFKICNAFKQTTSIFHFSRYCSYTLYILFSLYVYATFIQGQFPERIIFPEELNKFLQNRIHVSIILIHVKSLSKNKNIDCKIKMYLQLFIPYYNPCITMQSCNIIKKIKKSGNNFLEYKCRIFSYITIYILFLSCNSLISSTSCSDNNCMIGFNCGE